MRTYPDTDFYTLCKLMEPPRLVRYHFSLFLPFMDRASRHNLQRRSLLKRQLHASAFAVSFVNSSHLMHGVTIVSQEKKHQPKNHLKVEISLHVSGRNALNSL